MSNVPSRVYDATTDREKYLSASFLASYRNPTRDGYAIALRQWFDWCHRKGVDPIDGVIRAHIELWAREREEINGNMASTVSGKLNAVCGFYRYAYIDGAIGANPAEHVKRPPVPHKSTRVALTEGELLKVVKEAAKTGRDSEVLLIGLLGLEGMRIGEALKIDLEHVRRLNGELVVFVERQKGNEQGEVPLPPRLAFIVDRMLQRHETGALLRRRDGSRMDRPAAGRVVARLVKAVGIDKTITPHCLRHSFVTIALDNGCHPRDIQNSLGWADLRQVSYYDRNRASVARHASRRVSAAVEAA